MTKQGAVVNSGYVVNPVRKAGRETLCVNHIPRGGFPQVVFPAFPQWFSTGSEFSISGSR